MRCPRRLSLAIAATLPALLLACANHSQPQAPASLTPIGARTGDCSPGWKHRLKPLNTTETSSAIALAEDEDRRRLAFIADEDDKALHVIDVQARRELTTVPLAGTPSHVLVALDGRVLVTLRDAAKVEVLTPSEKHDASRLVSRCTVPTAVEPIAIAETIDESTFVVTSGWGHSLDIFAHRDLAPRARVELPREPRGVHIAPDGRSAVVAHLLGSNLSVVDLQTAEARQIDTHGASETREVRLKKPPVPDPPPQPKRTSKSAFPMKPMAVAFDFTIQKMPIRRHAINGVALAMVGNKMIGPRVLVDPGELDEVAVYYGGGDRSSEVADVLILDDKLRPVSNGPPRASSTTATGAIVPPLPESRNGCHLPRSIAHDTDDDTALVACLGSNMLVEYAIGSAPTPMGVVRRQWPVAKGPVAVAYDAKGKEAIVWSQYDHATSFVALAEAQVKNRVTRLNLARPQSIGDGDAELGRQIFHATDDRRISREGLACASCHPDGRDDGLTWATQEGPRNAPMLAGRLEGTAPYAWSGTGTQLTDHLMHTVQRLGGSGLTPREMDALAAYCVSMKTYENQGRPPTSSHEAKLARGKAIFNSGEAKCATCHAPGNDNAFTDKMKHDVGSQSLADAASQFDTPSLRFVGLTAPYFHDGRYANLRELLVKSTGKMGQTSHLAPADLDALEAYLKTL